MGGFRVAALGALSAFLLVVGYMPAAHANEFVTANPDTVHTTVDTPVNFDPTANDTVGSELEVVSVDIESSPDHGTATINPDGVTINYVPDAGYVGPDSMQYNVHVCSSIEHGTGCNEDGSDIAITVDPGDDTTTTSTTEVAVPTTTVAPTTTIATATTNAPTSTVAISALASSTTTVAPAAAQLPRTGSSSGPLGFLSVVALGLGSLLLALSRRRASASS